jgi:hypothetical protein
MPKPVHVAPPLAAALIISLAGCGDSGPLDPDELVSRGDELCREGQERFIKIQATPPATSVEAAGQTEELIEVSETELDDLEELEPPAELEEAYERYLDARREAIELLKRGRKAAERQDGRAYARAQARSLREAGERRRLARAVGFEACSQEGASG